MASDQPQTTGSPVRAHHGRIYITLGGVEHGMLDSEAEALVRALAPLLRRRIMVIDGGEPANV